ncbi:glycosyltransferase family 4 protein [Streptomyces sp. NPDC021098]|uniref:glycosyltransferase family 4 protein n=1 Tax=unclassified Streptomyces TaxID=2593676 RepID=UPI0037BD9117
MAEKAQRILMVCTQSGLGKGGVPVFNWQLSEALAKEHHVTLLTTRPDTPPHEGVTLLHTPEPPLMAGPGSDPWEERVWLEWCAQHDPRTFGLPAAGDNAFDVIVGHSRFSGPAAAQLRERWYPSAKLAHFLHTSPEKLPPAKYPDDPQMITLKTERDLGLELECMSRSDIVVGVGPLLRGEAEKITSGLSSRPSVHELVPGTRIFEPVTPAGSQERLNVLAMGRADDPLKGFRDVAIAVNDLNAAGIDVRLTVLGANEENLAVAKKQFAVLAGHENVEVKAFIKNPDQLMAEVRTADAVIMPSKHEGFGMVATEALGHGIPVLVNQDSGAAQFLGDQNRIPADIGSPCVVPEPAPSQRRPDMWANAIAQLKEELPQRREGARQLQQELRKYSWTHGSTAFVTATEDAVHIRTRTTLQAQQTVATTVQGPNGTVLRSDAANPRTVGPQEQSHDRTQRTAQVQESQKQPQNQTAVSPSLATAPVMNVQQLAALRSAKMPGPAGQPAHQSQQGTHGPGVPRQTPLPHKRPGPGPAPAGGDTPRR